MFRLFIVDDEPTIRKGLSQFIPWETVDAQIVGEANDGASALARIAELRPDIVIADIRMPNMNGLELARHIREEYYGIKVILLTGYADFDYAQSAIRYGVVDFVLKPTSKDKILAAVKSAQERILAERKQDYAQNGDLTALQEQMLEQLTRGLAEGDCSRDRLHTYSISLSHYFLAAFQLSEYQAEKKRSNLLSLKNMLALSNGDGYTYFYDNSIVLSIFHVASPQSEVPAEILTKCREILDIVNNFSETKVSIGISRCHSGPEELPRAGEEVVRALSGRFFTGKDISVAPARQEEKPTTVTAGQSLFLCELETLLESHDFDAVSESLSRFFSDQTRNVANAMDTINICFLINMICVRVLSKNERPPLDPAYRERIQSCVSISDLRRVTEELVGVTAQSLCHIARKTSPTVTQALAYIHEHYAENLHLNTIAEFVHINPHHLCRIFKRECGETINEYITDVRIEKAKELLRDGENLAYEVAEKVGFNDPAYFSSLFKKKTGVSPKNYK